MVMTLPKSLLKLRGPDRTKLAERIKSELADRADLVERIKAELPDRAELAERIRLPDLPDRTELAQRIKMPELPDLPDLPNIDLSGLPRRFPWRRRRAPGRALSITPTLITMLAIVLSGIVGALVAYFFDPDRGKSRRLDAADRMAGLGAQARRRVGSLARSTASTEDSVESVGSATGKSHPNGEMASPDGTIDDLVPANPGL